METIPQPTPRRSMAGTGFRSCLSFASYCCTRRRMAQTLAQENGAHNIESAPFKGEHNSLLVVMGVRTPTTVSRLDLHRTLQGVDARSGAMTPWPQRRYPRPTITAAGAQHSMMPPLPHSSTAIESGARAPPRQRRYPRDLTTG